jgi:hypothetical protein
MPNPEVLPGVTIGSVDFSLKSNTLAAGMASMPLNVYTYEVTATEIKANPFPANLLPQAATSAKFSPNGKMLAFTHNDLTSNDNAQFFTVIKSAPAAVLRQFMSV